MVNPEDDHPQHGGGSGEDHHYGVVRACSVIPSGSCRVLTQYRSLHGGGDALGHGHQEDGHVEHGGDAQCRLLPGLRWYEENKPGLDF